MINFEEHDYLDNQTNVQIIADSYSTITNTRATTMLWRVPRIILPELNTHRIFSRNVASNRARRFASVAEDMTYVPSLWLENHKGMQASSIAPQWKANLANLIWKSHKILSYIHGVALDKLNITKQLSNRTIESHTYINYLVSSTEWQNFLTQRDDPGAMFEIQVLARKVKEALKESKPTLLNSGEWHLPFITEWEKERFDTITQIKLSVARCARTSYGNNASKVENDIKLYNQLVLSKPPHLSPTEHQLLSGNPTGNLEGNTKGFIQYRKLLEFYQFEQERVNQYVESIT